jgi:hypothetical protein
VPAFGGNLSNVTLIEKLASKVTRQRLKLLIIIIIFIIINVPSMWIELSLKFSHQVL